MPGTLVYSPGADLLRDGYKDFHCSRCECLPQFVFFIVLNLKERRRTCSAPYSTVKGFYCRPWHCFLYFTTRRHAFLSRRTRCRLGCCIRAKRLASGDVKKRSFLKFSGIYAPELVMRTDNFIFQRPLQHRCKHTIHVCIRFGFSHAGVDNSDADSHRCQNAVLQHDRLFEVTRHITNHFFSLR